MDEVARIVPARIVCHILGIQNDWSLQLTRWAESRAIVTWGFPSEIEEKEGHVLQTLDLLGTSARA